VAGLRVEQLMDATADDWIIVLAISGGLLALVLGLG
jgi:hypothetical protein